MKKIIGKIISAKMQKTKVVASIEMHRHPLYHRAYPKTTKILAHDEKDEYNIGDEVEIVSTRPKSKNKAWKIVRKIK